MTDHILPRYPVYIPSKGRADVCYTAHCLLTAGVPFYLVIEPTEADTYTAQFGTERLLLLPFHDLGLGSIPARNFIWEHAKSTGAERHWTLDDNIRYFKRRYRAKRLYCDAGIALRVCEDFTDRYENIAISGLDYEMFVPDNERVLPVQINCHVYSCMLILNSLPYRWRGRYNEDTDLCLQVLANSWCTVLLNTFVIHKMHTMHMKGGNTDTLYQGDGRLRMARSLERMWPGVVKTDRRFQRPQHKVKDDWKRFDTPLRLKPGIDLAQLQPNEYGMSLVQVTEEIKSPRIQGLLDTWQQTHTMEESDAPTLTQAADQEQAATCTQAVYTQELTAPEEDTTPEVNHV
jgi:hypothetical protein